MFYQIQKGGTVIDSLESFTRLIPEGAEDAVAVKVTVIIDSGRAFYRAERPLYKSYNFSYSDRVGLAR